MTGIGNNLPRSAMGMNNAQNLQNLQKTDKSGLVGEAQEATAAGSSEGETTCYAVWNGGNGGNVIGDPPNDYRYVTKGKLPNGAKPGDVVIFDNGDIARVTYDQYGNIVMEPGNLTSDDFEDGRGDYRS